jgi:hypothetical protein
MESSKLGTGEPNMLDGVRKKKRVVGRRMNRNILLAALVIRGRVGRIPRSVLYLLKFGSNYYVPKL